MSTEPKLIPLRIRLPYQTEEEFIDKYGSNVARGGVFIATRALKPEGTQLAFEFVLADGARLLRGDGVVVKNQVDEGGTRAGMTVRFVRLDAASKALIDRVVAHRSGVAGRPPEHVLSSAPEQPPATPAQLAQGADAEAKAQPSASAPAESPAAEAKMSPAPASSAAATPSSEARTSSASASPSGATPVVAARPVSPPLAAEAKAPSAPESPAEATPQEEAPPASSPAPAFSAAETKTSPRPASPSGTTPVVEAPPESPPPAAPAVGETKTSPTPASPSGATPVVAAPPLSRPPITEAKTPPAPQPSSDTADRPRRRRSALLDAAATPAPATPEHPDLVLGIDLGTTNARVAVYQDGAPTLIPLWQDGRTAMVSCAAVDEAGALVVGDTARERMAHAPHEGITAAKRLIGRRARAKRVKEEAARLPYELVPDAQGDTAVRLRDRVRSLTEISAALLSALKTAAESHLGHGVSRAVLCVPAYFTDHQRQAMREAGRQAGLEVLRIFNEPSAVALAFGHGKALPRKRILVYDLGGGTFDATVVEVTGDELEAVANGGDNFLGGMDFDAKIAAALADRFAQAERVSIDTSPIASLRLREASERAKIALSEAETTRVTVPGAALRPDGTAVTLDLELGRAEMEAVTDELVERTLQVTRDVLASAQLSAQSLDEVLLVGGQSRSPKVRARVEELVGRPVRTDVDAQAAVAFGAAILGHALIEAAKGKPGVVLSEVLSAPIGIATRDGCFRRVLERNTRLPAEKTILIPGKAGESLAVAVCQGTAERAEDNEYLGSLSATLERNGELQVRFAVASDGTLELSAAGPGGHRASVAISTEDASDETRAALYAAAPLPGEEESGKKGVFGGLKRLFGRR